MRIAIVAGETSGDMLGAALMQSLIKIYPDAVFEGIGGERMCQHGFHSLFPMEILSVMGLIEPLKRLPQLLKVKNALVSHFKNQKPDIFIGVDSPEFNQRIELPLKEAGIPTVHYVSPSVWAWRQGRLKGIRKAVDLMLCLLPFEAAFYEKEQVPARFVGHPMADEIPVEPLLQNDPEIDAVCTKSSQNIALMPGSRSSEISKIAPIFFQVAEQLYEVNSNSVFLVPAAHQTAFNLLNKIKGDRDYIHIIEGKVRPILARSKKVLVASGTATLEAMLMKCPMVVAYKMDSFSWFIGSRLVKSEYVSLANLVAGKGLVKERLQDDCNPRQLLTDLQELDRPEIRNTMVHEFTELHKQLRHGASDSAAKSISELIHANCRNR